MAAMGVDDLEVVASSMPVDHGVVAAEEPAPDDSNMCGEADGEGAAGGPVTVQLTPGEGECVVCDKNFEELRLVVEVVSSRT